MKLTANILRSLLDYDPVTGVFLWRVSRGRARVGSVAGCKNINGYLVIRIFSKPFFAHRLAVLWMTGKWPPRMVDHENRKQTINRWSNLRLATGSQNRANSISRRKLPKGVCLDRNRDKYRATIKVTGKVTHLGYFDEVKDAQLAYANAARKHFGEFARA